MQHLLLLHGAIGSSKQLSALADQLSAEFEIHTLDFSGHGGKAVDGHAFSIELFANDVLRYLDEHKIKQVSIFGYSMGGYVALYLAKHHADRISKVATLATKFDWNESVAANEAQMLDPSKISEKIPAFAKALEQRHAPADWKEVLGKTADMITALGKKNTLVASDYATINVPAMILLGDRDKMVGLGETLAVFRSLLYGQFGVLPNAGHPIEEFSTTALAVLLREFFRD